ncbi:hypothetical protein D3C71_1753650 [compost metagenome]
MMALPRSNMPSRSVSCSITRRPCGVTTSCRLLSSPACFDIELSICASWFSAAGDSSFWRTRRPSPSSTVGKPVVFTWLFGFCCEKLIPGTGSRGIRLPGGVPWCSMR